jgi:hypothetical protein
MDRLRELAAAAEHYRVVMGVCCTLLVFDILGSFRFQPQLGLITRTLEVKFNGMTPLIVSRAGIPAVMGSSLIT